ncbi:peptide chain release factor N(5)-glutamine methyltransferase [Neosynechococcus sphagnicola]|uniref:peptide chain release factor N(5)-glutamine methyltransferase n=1 Tax=Neosynechococcus sphagnicola TaxID=1501145 RepID=UPI001EF9FDA3|nr:peptide chain release factor N(5)-glutamine methyltransferase [Neosynechococcus sphagnicola]
MVFRQEITHLSDRCTLWVTGTELWRWRRTALEAAQSADIAAAEIDWFLQELTGLDRLRLYTLQDCPQIQIPYPLSEFSKLWDLRTHQRVPIQYLTGTTPWRHFSLAVSPAVLIPRPETELLIDLAIALAPTFLSDIAVPMHWVDLGTGSGAIALALNHAFPQATIHAVDYSPEALRIARYNAERQGLGGDRIQWYQGSWWEPLTALRGKLLGMVSNPPYIPSQMIAQLQPEVAWHEPHLALDGGADGLGCIRHLVQGAPDYLQTGGLWLVEMMAGQAATVVDLLTAQGDYTSIQVHRDLAGIDRFVSAVTQPRSGVSACPK